MILIGVTSCQFPYCRNKATHEAMYRDDRIAVALCDEHTLQEYFDACDRCSAD